jgi:DNA polymerase-1
VNNSRNVQIQGLAASIVNRAAIAINRKFKEAGINGWVCAQIHDQIICEVEESKSQEAAKIVQDCMENTTKISIALKAPPAIAHNWRDGHS